MRERKESDHANDISRECKGKECKSKWQGKLIDKTQQEFGTMQEVFIGYEEENGDEGLGEFNHLITFLL